MDGEIQFGELEEARPRPSLRPDENRHFAVCAYGQPAEHDIPVFIDLDALEQMELHALSDTSVELGGVMLGAQCLDEHGRPFVLISDVLAAEHYKSTRGSFKFTHDTWSEITRQRSEFPNELQMVGWYHTHPDWGVFLSGMDMFICENFFNKPLDIALVIDPCRGDRGVFYWQAPPSRDVQQAAGFYVTATRFRADELAHYVQQLEDQTLMTTRTRLPASQAGVGAPVVNIAETRAPWLVVATLGMLGVQFALLALLAWRMLTPAAGPQPSASPQADVAQLLERYLTEERRIWEADAKLRVIDEILAQDGQGEQLATRLASTEQQLVQARAALEGLDAARREATRLYDDNAKALQQLKKDSDQQLKSLGDKIQRAETALENQPGTVEERERYRGSRRSRRQPPLVDDCGLRRRRAAGGRRNRRQPDRHGHEKERGAQRKPRGRRKSRPLNER
jgi:proteasome lid subunit RPN8/RPN11